MGKKQQLVQEGKGTRDWTEEQQKNILDPDNIQFLTREEHLEAHKGSWQNPTNWYYNPETKEFIDFGENKYVPCEIIDLTYPVIRVTETVRVSPETTEFSQKGNKEKKSGNEQGRNNSSPTDSITSVPYEAKASPKHSKSFGKKIMDAVEAVKGFSERHPVLTDILKAAGVAAVAVGTEVIANSGKGSGSGLRSYMSDDYFRSSSDNDYDDFLDTDEYDDAPSSRDCPDERSSPEEHTVPAHGQHYHTKDGVI